MAMGRLSRFLSLGILTSFLALTGCASSAVHHDSHSYEDKPFKALLATDTHYLAPSLTDHGAFYEEGIAGGDGKDDEYSPEIFHALLAQAEAEKPDALILTGDLTYNGEKTSHEELAAFLEQLRQKGVQPLVLSGNHDLNNGYALAYQGSTALAIPTVDRAAFRKIYANAGYEQAYAQDPHSLSYFYEARKDLDLLFIDSNAIVVDYLGDDTLSWMESELAKAKEKGHTVLSFTHQSVLLQNPLLKEGYLIGNQSALLSLLERYGVRVNFSGHIHLQHQASDGKLRDIATSSLLVSPNHCARLEVGAEGLSYQSQDLDVAAYAKAAGLSDPHLLDFANYSASYFRDFSAKRIEKRLAEATLSESDKTALVETYVALNQDYFAGVPTDLTPYAKGLALWKDSSLPSAAYVAQMASEADQDYRSFTLDLALS
jgi:3',5'-cyclic AMP phosphodiesterase CpdA